MSINSGIGTYSALGFAQESALGTAVNPSFWVPFVSAQANFKVNSKPQFSPGGTFVHCLLTGTKDVTGAITTEDFATLPALMKWWNGRVAITGPSGGQYTYTFDPQDNTSDNRLPSFTVSRFPDNDNSERFAGCRMDTLHVSFRNGSGPVQFQFGFKGLTATKVSNLTPSVNRDVVQMAHNTTVKLNGVQSQLVAGFDLHGQNHLVRLPKFDGSGNARDFFPGVRDATGTMTALFEDHSLWDTVVSQAPVEIEITVGTPPATNAMKITVPAAILQSADTTLQDTVLLNNCPFIAVEGNSMDFEVVLYGISSTVP